MARNGGGHHHSLPHIFIHEMAVSTIAWSVGHKNGAEKWLSANAIRLFASRQFRPFRRRRRGHTQRRGSWQKGNTCVHDGQAGRQTVMLFFTADSSGSANPHTSPISSAITRVSSFSPRVHTLGARLLRVGNLDKYTRVRHDLTEVDVGRIGGRRRKESDKRPRLENCLALLAPSSPLAWSDGRKGFAV